MPLPATAFGATPKREEALLLASSNGRGMPGSSENPDHALDPEVVPKGTSLIGLDEDDEAPDALFDLPMPGSGSRLVGRSFTWPSP
mmetsp:Transcript_84885/g.147230  ORF Transcript_84885/g.147230 Transcript_84885/m.147230 type:complete len:86 (-) Transcript_84885:523-780(-)